MKRCPETALPKDPPVDRSILASMWAMISTMLLTVGLLAYSLWPESQ